MRVAVWLNDLARVTGLTGMSGVTGLDWLGRQAILEGLIGKNRLSGLIGLTERVEFAD